MSDNIHPTMRRVCAQEYHIMKHDYFLALLTNLEEILRSPTIFIHNMTKHGTDVLLVNKRRSRPYLNDLEVFATVLDQPIHTVIRDLLLDGDLQGVYDHLLRTAIGGLLRAPRNLSRLMQEGHADIVETIGNMLPFPAKKISLDTKDATRLHRLNMIDRSLSMGTKCLMRLQEKMPSISHYLENDLEPFIDKSNNYATVSEREAWSKSSAEDQIEGFRSLWSVITQEWEERTLLSIITQESDEEEDTPWDKAEREAAVKKFIVFFQHDHIEDLKQVVVEMREYLRVLEGWQRGPPDEPPT
ncbi:uncharacterized protein BKA78DRAFT_298766 [Phyllosticta capitalensis]|uniref:uncharacterized protein n=1 Tax=Phyllosticta capitalensis TaxID=121624 RepID=UPI003130C0D5